MAYSGRRGPNVSEYIANLNTIPSEQDVQDHDEHKFEEDDLSMFINTNFFDYDLGQSTDVPASDFVIDGIDSNGQPALSDPAEIKQFFGDFSFTDFNTFNRSTDSTSNLTTVDTKTSYPPSSSAGSPSSGLVSPQTGSLLSTPVAKRKADSISSPTDNIEESVRAVAEEDKRRRNTAASARFRVKKKQREQALEKSAKEMSDKVSALEGKINQLETENKWLKNLITEKNQTQKEDLQAMYRRFSGEKQKADRKGDERKDGVGTSM